MGKNVHVLKYDTGCTIQTANINPKSTGPPSEKPKCFTHGQFCSNMKQGDLSAPLLLSRLLQAALGNLHWARL